MEDSGWRRNKYGGWFNINDYMNDRIRGINDYNENEDDFLVDNQNLIYDPYNLTQQQRDSIREYTNGIGYGDFKLINGYLNETRELSDGAKEIIRQKIKTLDSCINAETKKPFYTYHGTKLNKENLSVGQIIENKGYTSTSIFKNDAGDFTGPNGTIIKLKVKLGTKALYIGENTSNYKNEHELLIEKGKSIKIIKNGDEVIGELV